VLNMYVQQWTAIQTARAANLRFEDVFMSFLELTGDADELEIEGYLRGLLMLPAPDRDLLAQAINELLDSTGSMVDGAHYSDADAESSSGYSDYLRTLDLSPEKYNFSAPPARRPQHQLHQHDQYWRSGRPRRCRRCCCRSGCKRR
jgi:hypothetical protein